MEYELPKSIKRHSFWCEAIKDFTNFSGCTKGCLAWKKTEASCLDCWEKNLRADLLMDCAVTNEHNAEDYAVCPKCASDNVVGCAFNSFLCVDCGEVFELDKDGQKGCLGEQYQEVNTDVLNALIKKARDSIK